MGMWWSPHASTLHAGSPSQGSLSWHASRGRATASLAELIVSCHVTGNSQSYRTKLLIRPAKCRTYTFNLVESSSGTNTLENNKARCKEGTTSWSKRFGHANPSAFVNPTQSLKGTETCGDSWRRSAPWHSILRNLRTWVRLLRLASHISD